VPAGPVLPSFISERTIGRFFGELPEERIFPEGLAKSPSWPSLSFGAVYHMITSDKRPETGAFSELPRLEGKARASVSVRRPKAVTGRMSVAFARALDPMKKAKVAVAPAKQPKQVMRPALRPHDIIRKKA
jgi:hypothetical protein